MWSLPALQQLELSGCESLTSIGVSLSAGTDSIITFPKLNFLEIKYCDKLSIVNGLLTLEYLPAIERIHVMSCKELLSLSRETFGGLSSLKHLYVYECPRLNWQRELALPSCLRTLELNDCGDFPACVLGCLENLTSLVSLKMVRCQGLTSIPSTIWRNNLVLLEQLEIWNCLNLVSIGGAEAVAKIKRVEILNCPKLDKAEQVIRGGWRYGCYTSFHSSIYSAFCPKFVKENH
jgi:hypothetical protein